MANTAAQLTLGLSLHDEATFSNFFNGKNEEVVLALKHMIDTLKDLDSLNAPQHNHPKELSFFLSGSRGEGCSHLLQACCHYASQKKMTSVYLPLSQFLHLSPQFLEGFELLDIVCLDDVQVIAGEPAWEESVFHLFNRIYDSGRGIIMAANESPKNMALTLPDLVSRLSGGILYKLLPLADAEKLSALILRAHYRGITLSEEVGNYILTHCPRHMGTLMAALDVLDKASLAAQRRLTIPFVKEVLQI